MIRHPQDAALDSWRQLLAAKSSSQERGSRRTETALFSVKSALARKTTLNGNVSRIRSQLHRRLLEREDDNKKAAQLIREAQGVASSVPKGPKLNAIENAKNDETAAKTVRLLAKTKEAPMKRLKLGGP